MKRKFLLDPRGRCGDAITRYSGSGKSVGAPQLNSHDPIVASAFATLDLPLNSSRQQVKEAYRDLVQVWHPDRFGHSQRLRSQAEAKLRDINQAYEILERYFSGQWNPSSNGDKQAEAPTSPISMSSAEMLLRRLGVALSFLLPGVVAAAILVFGILGFPFIDLSGFALLNTMGALQDGAGKPILDERLADASKFQIIRNPDGSAMRSPDGGIMVKDLEKERSVHADMQRAKVESNRGWFLFYVVIALFVAAGWKLSEPLNQIINKWWFDNICKVGFGLSAAFFAASLGAGFNYMVISLFVGFGVSHYLLTVKLHSAKHAAADQ